MFQLNLITQGEQVAAVWKPLLERFGIHIDFGYRTFKWSNEAKGKAAVYCVIVGFSGGRGGDKTIYDGDDRITANNISPYLIDAPDIFVESRSTALCDSPTVIWGNKPVDGGNLIIEADEYAEFLEREPDAQKYIRRFVGAEEYINKLPRYCLWLVGVPPMALRKMSLVVERVEKVRQMRLASPKAATQKSAETPTLFQEVRQPDMDYILIPSVSSEQRRYILYRLTA